MKRIFLSMLAVSVLVFSSCSKDDTPTTGVTAPATYKFERAGSSTVSFSGQTTRILMAEELVSALKDPLKTTEALNGMFAHAEGVNDFPDADLNASSKNIHSKTAASKDYFSSNTTEANAIKAKFEAWITAQVDEVFPNWDVDAEVGVAGKIQEAGGGSTRYVNGKGLELNQAFAKSLIGGLMTDQILNNYLSVSVLDEASNVSDNDNDVLITDKNYTTMEHKWDEAYGYLYGAEVDATIPVLGADSFLNKYVNSVDSDDDFAGIANDIYEAFKLGRAAIVAKDYEVRDAQANIIREAVSKVIAIRAVYYLQTGKESLSTDKAAAFHDLSEGFGFIQSLRFTRSASTNQPHLPVAEIEAFLGVLMDGNGFWSVSADALDQISTRIASVYGFTVAEAAN
ncbi:uncharacterized protein DUF4856 [Tenacibaculum adriaticum]|uniref:Uncharacterized protein DUF4856 n=1 Tax=Tenacibaculum adriaticum TaxID=413713 RepID=A0A5S5DSN5_9FLAO|nr:DUF4856 domain-containing protein [Tenacibaculum adriaticum]TYP98785.1 uncharacterized protein DUF4856 [Tenacibaculum adriaticum]